MNGQSFNRMHSLVRQTPLEGCVHEEIPLRGISPEEKTSFRAGVTDLLSGKNVKGFFNLQLIMEKYLFKNVMISVVALLLLFCTKTNKMDNNIMNKTYYKIEKTLYDNVRVIPCSYHSFHWYIKLDSLCPLQSCTVVLTSCTYKTVFIVLFFVFFF